MYKKLMFLFFALSINQIDAACQTECMHTSDHLSSKNKFPNFLERLKKTFTERIEFINYSGEAPDSYPELHLNNLSSLKNKLDKFNEDASKHLGNAAEECHVQILSIPSGSEICFMGDIHGSLHSLLRNLLYLYLLEYIDEHFKIIKPNFYMIFLGDYVDRGRYGVEVLDTLLSLTSANGKNILLTRGNHENQELNDKYGFISEIMTKFFRYHGERKEQLIQSILKFYSNLPLAVYINSGNDNSWIQCCHGGIDPIFNPKAVLNNKKSGYLVISEFIDYTNPFDTSIAEADIIKFNKHTMDESDCGFNCCDFTDKDLPFFIYGKRGYLCTISMARKLMAECGIKAIFRGHQHNLFGLKLGGETHWKDYIPNQTTFNISPYPVFTFSTAAEGAGLPYDCFGILKTADKYEDWILTPYEFKLPSNRNEKYVHITMATKGQAPLFEWHNEPQTA